MQQLVSGQFALVKPLFAPLFERHLSVEAVLANTVPGEVHVDDLDHPRVGLILTPEGHYLVGDVACERVYPALRELIPLRAYLTVEPIEWEEKLPQIWKNSAVRRHPRYHLHLDTLRLPDWRERIPDGFRIVQIDAPLLAQGELQNIGVIRDRVDGWGSQEHFLAQGFGFCALENHTIAANCIADCVVGEKCEVGIRTEMDYRRRGLAALLAAAAVEHCLSRGITTIGWHCTQTNAGSIAVAQKVGFVIDSEYFSHSSFLPAENATDLTPAEYREWAAHYERFAAEQVLYSYDAARAWALAGEPEVALEQLRRVLAQGWRGRPEWLAHNWVFASLRGIPEFESMIAILQEHVDNVASRPASDA